MKRRRGRIGLVCAVVLLATACSSAKPAPTETEEASAAETTVEPSAVVLTTAGGWESETAEKPSAASSAAETEPESGEAEESSGTEETSAAEEPPAESSVTVSEGMEGLAMAERPGAYRLQYDPSMFELVEGDGMDSYKYIIEDTLPVCVRVVMMPETPVQDMVDALIARSGRADVQATDAEMGENMVPAKSIYLEQEVNGEMQIQLFYVMEWGSGSIVIETDSHTGAGEGVDSGIETILGTFELLN